MVVTKAITLQVKDLTKDHADIVKCEIKWLSEIKWLNIKKKDVIKIYCIFHILNYFLFQTFKEYIPFEVDQ